ncbi:MAG: CoA transferase subunit A [Alphaproteobacteria bacterium]
MAKEFPLLDIDALVANVEDGAKVVLPPDYSGAPMATVRALVRKGVRNLHLVGAPQFGLPADILVGAGSVDTVETAGLGLGEFGLAPRFRDAVAAGSIHVKDATCPAVHAGLQAAEKGVPFMPVRGIIGSDLLRYRNDWTVIDAPLGDGGPILLVEAIEPDIAIAHVPYADRFGNVWVGLRREIMTMAHAAKRTLITFEKLYDGNLLDNVEMAPGTLPSHYVTAISQQEKGCWPLGFLDWYETDIAHMERYVDLARTEEGFARYLDEHVLNAAEAA